jgi:hypothetical protein
MTFESEIHISHPNLDDKPEINNTEIRSTDKSFNKASFQFWAIEQEMSAILLKYLNLRIVFKKKVTDKIIYFFEKNANFGLKLYFWG